MQLLQETSGVFMRKLFVDHPRVADAVVQCLFLIIKGRHDVTNQADQCAQILRQAASASAREANRSAIRRDDFQTAGHFARRCAVFGKEKSRVQRLQNEATDVP